MIIREEGFFEAVDSCQRQVPDFNMPQKGGYDGDLLEKLNMKPEDF